MEVLVALSTCVRNGSVLALGLLVGTLALAQEPTFTVQTNPGEVSGARLTSPEMRLTLNEAISLALGHNINLEISRLGYAGARKGIIAATGIFDPGLGITYTESGATSPATNQLVGAQVNKTKQRVFNIGYQQLLATGLNYSIGWNNSRSETNSTFYFLNPAYNSGLALQLTQPLLNGFGTDVNRSGIEVARRNSEISQLDFERIVISTVQQVEDAYWNLVYARNNLTVQQESLKLAQDLLEQTRTRVRIGTSAPIDIVQSEATVAAREQEIIVAENAVSNAGDILKQLMGVMEPQDWKAEVIPIDKLEQQVPSVNLDEAIEAALKSRVELRQSRLSTQISEINVVSAASAVLPSLDLNVTYGYTGVGGTYTNPDTGVVTPGGWDDALDQIRKRDYNRWSAGLSFTYPLGNHQAKATLAQRRFEFSSAQRSLAAERQTVIAEVRQAVRNMEASANLITASVKARELAERNLDAEQKKFANGMSTNYQVLQIQQDLATAQVTELQSRVAFRQSRVAYYVAIGKLLEEMNVHLEGGKAEKEPHTFLSGVDWLKYSHWAHPLAGMNGGETGAGGKPEKGEVAAPAAGGGE
jgi:outer membrane protein